MADEQPVVWVHRTMIVTAEVVVAARAMAASFGDNASGMWDVPLSPNGEEPASHYISAGLIDAAFATMLSSPENLFAAAQAQGIETTLEFCQGLLAQAIISEKQPFPLLAELGLQLVVPEDQMADEA